MNDNRWITNPKIQRSSSIHNSTVRIIIYKTNPNVAITKQNTHTLKKSSSLLLQREQTRNLCGCVLRLLKLITLLRVATTDEERGGGEGREGETRNSRIHVFLSSIFSSLGGVFGSNFQESHKLTAMASRAVIAPTEQNQPRGLFFFFSFLTFFVVFDLTLKNWRLRMI